MVLQKSQFTSQNCRPIAKHWRTILTKVRKWDFWSSSNCSRKPVSLSKHLSHLCTSPTMEAGGKGSIRIRYCSQKFTAYVFIWTQENILSLQGYLHSGVHRQRPTRTSFFPLSSKGHKPHGIFLQLSKSRQQRSQAKSLVTGRPAEHEENTVKMITLQKCNSLKV